MPFLYFTYKTLHDVLCAEQRFVSCLYVAEFAPMPHEIESKNGFCIKTFVKNVPQKEELLKMCEKFYADSIWIEETKLINGKKVKKFSFVQESSQ